MSTVSIRELSRNTSGVVAEVSASGRPAVVTKHGAPVAAVIPIDAGELEDFVLANAPRYLADMNAAKADLREGHTRNAAEVFAELDS
jgi:prevent-host-death family protein